MRNFDRTVGMWPSYVRTEGLEGWDYRPLTELRKQDGRAANEQLQHSDGSEDN